MAASPLWQRRRLWYAPPQHVLLQRAVCRAATVQFAALLSHAHLACMWDHQVMAPHPIILVSANKCILHIRHARNDFYLMETLLERIGEIFIHACSQKRS